MKRSDNPYPFPIIIKDEYDFLKEAWENGWLNEYSEEHFLIRVIEDRLDDFQGKLQLYANDVPIYPVDSFRLNFCVNFSSKMHNLKKFFGRNEIKRFVTDQLSAGKENYDERKFFQALSEVSILRFWQMRSKLGYYEPKINGKRNPEARFECNNGSIVDIEVKTGGFDDLIHLEDMAIPTVLLNDEGRKEFQKYCEEHDIKGYMPRVMKLKDFLNSAVSKFELVDHINHINLLYINWTFSEFIASGFEEAFSIFANSVNGVLTHKDIGLKIGIDEDVYEKITAVIVYTESISGLMFGDFRWVWTRGDDGMSHFGIIGMHECERLLETTGMNPYAEQLTPAMLAYLKNTSHTERLLQIIGENLFCG
ncbi:MAG: hypothetical protein IJ682_10695 [Lachnospiraceae bacterium]|nr:hypothetical protein [Lachnospiraceae bacterium]